MVGPFRVLLDDRPQIVPQLVLGGQPARRPLHRRRALPEHRQHRVLHAELLTRSAITATAMRASSAVCELRGNASRPRGR